MTITELKYIVAVARERHFGRAAASVFVSQPTLSVGIKKLEQELGVKIFERLSNKVVPTQAGQKIIEAAQNTLMSTEMIRSIAADSKGDLSGDIRLGAIYTMCPYLLPRIIPDLKQHAPNLRLYIKEDYTHNLLAQLKSGDIDMAIVSTPLPESNLFDYAIISEEDFLVVLPSQHHLSERQHVNIDDLVNEHIFLLGGGNCFRDQVIKSCPTCINHLEDNKLLEGGSLETIRMMVAGGLGLSIFPQMAIVDTPNLSVRPFEDSTKPSRNIAIVWRKSFIQQSIITAVKDSVARCT